MPNPKSGCPLGHGVPSGPPKSRAAGGSPGARKYDLVAIDVDGTLVDSQNNMSEAVEAALRDLRAEGAEVVLVSGRPHVAALPVFKRLGLRLPLVSSGGAYVVDTASGRVIAQFLPSSSDMRQVVALAREAGLTLVYQMSDEVYCEGSPQILEAIRSAVRVPIEMVDDGLAVCPEPIKISVCGRREKLDRIDAAIKERGLAVSAVLSGPEYLEVAAQGVSKGEALRRVSEYLDVPLERIMVIGDAPNDVSMFEVAGLSVAMGNAPLEVKEAADVVAPTLEEDGVAWALRELVHER
jgi:Cof subfamily protein (haloacid dehalogenase superfamily)